jgi:Tol biopolymer transport system component
MTRSHPSGPLVLWALLGSGTALGCGDGRSVNLGSIESTGTQSSPPSAGTSPCGEHSCANETGPVLFIDPSAADAAPASFDTDVEHAPGAEPGSEPSLVYPSDETRLPLNAAELRFAWTAGASDLFALDFVGPQTSVRVITRGTSFTPTTEQWGWLAESNRGGRVTWVVRGIAAHGASESWRSNPVELTFGTAALGGTIYYWSTGSRGLMRARFEDPNPSRYFTDAAGDDATTCTGCHTVSRDGKRLAAGFDKNQLAEFALDDRSLLLALDSTAAAAEPAPPGPMAMMDAGAPPDPAAKAPMGPLVWSTFSPDGTRLLVAGGGKLRLFDADTGNLIGAGDGTVPLPPGTSATHPDWSPLGDRVAVTLAGKGGDKQTEGGSIAVMSYANDAFGMPQVLVAPANDHDNDFFPSFSPDGRFIAYVNAGGPSQDAASAELRLLEVATGTTRALTRLNERVNGEDGVLGIGNTMPTWAPSDPDGSYWLVFSSLRAYADVRPQDPKQDQLWLAGIDPTLDDPGFAALWAPFQNLGQGNHRAFWTPSAAPANPCGATTCAPRETCDNGVDDDCDCVVDDCSQEICDDGIDNDGDGKTDKMDLACSGP